MLAKSRFCRNNVISYLLTFTFYILACKDDGSRASASSSRDLACSRMYQSRECRRVKLGLLFLNKTRTKLYTSYKLRCIGCSILSLCHRPLILLYCVFCLIDYFSIQEVLFVKVQLYFHIVLIKIAAAVLRFLA